MSNNNPNETIGEISARLDYNVDFVAWFIDTYKRKPDKDTPDLFMHEAWVAAIQPRNLVERVALAEAIDVLRLAYPCICGGEDLGRECRDHCIDFQTRRLKLIR